MDEVALAPADEVALAAGHIVRVSAEIGRVGRQHCVRGSVHGRAAGRRVAATATAVPRARRRDKDERGAKAVSHVFVS